MAEPSPLVAPGARTTKVRGRMSPGAAEALERLAPRYLVEADQLGADALDARFGRRSRRLLDIGVGNGTATVAWAAANPDRDVLVAELHRPGVSQLVRALEAQDLGNVIIAPVDVTALLADFLEPGSVDDVRVLFPDPWPKARHHKRRLVDATFLAQLARLLPDGGTLHVGTDSLDYAAHVREVLAADGRFAPVVDGEDEHGWHTTRPERPVTTYEQRGLKAGRTVTDLVAVLRPAG